MPPTGRIVFRCVGGIGFQKEENLDLDQLVFPAAQTDLLGVFQTALPVGSGAGIGEVVVVIVGYLVQMAAGHDRLPVNGIGAGLIQRYRVKAGEHAYIGYDRHIILGVAVTVGRYIDDQIDVELGTTADDRLAVLGDFAV